MEHLRAPPRMQYPLDTALGAALVEGEVIRLTRMASVSAPKPGTCVLARQHQGPRAIGQVAPPPRQGCCSATLWIGPRASQPACNLPRLTLTPHGWLTWLTAEMRQACDVSATDSQKSSGRTLCIILATK